MQSKTKECQNCKKEFTIEPEDFEFYEKIQVPEPTFCPECRMIRRLAFQNERKVYIRNCDKTGEKIFSMFSPDSPIKAYKQENWWADDWDVMEYGKDFDENKPFLEQLKALVFSVPWPSRPSHNLVNSDFSLNAQDIKDSYLVFVVENCEGCSYIQASTECKDCINGHGLEGCELVYEGMFLSNCYKAFYSQYCHSCQNIYFCKNCISCSDCFGCVNLKLKKYHIFNKAYSKEEYFQKLEEFGIESHQSMTQLQKEVATFRLKFPNKFMQGRKNSNIIGNEINNSKNVFNSHMVWDSEDVKYCQRIYGTKNAYDYSDWGGGCSLIYETSRSGNQLSKIKFCHFCIDGCRELEYSLNCYNSSNLFGCVGLRDKSYCILNKQYSKEKYEKLVSKIRQHMLNIPYTDSQGNVYKYGEYFPPELAPFAFNETVAQEYFPLTKEGAQKKGYRWHDREINDYQPTIKAGDIPDSIQDVEEAITKEIIECGNEPENSCQGSGVFRIIPSEFKFLKEHKIPLPRLCPECRHQERVKQRNPFRLYRRQCMCHGKQDQTGTYTNQNPNHRSHKPDGPCPSTFQTTYAPDRKEIVYCEECYQREVE